MSDPAIYKVLVESPLATGGAFSAGQVLTEGVDVEIGWSPVAGLVEPLNSEAALAYHATRPTPPPPSSFSPVTYWEVAELGEGCTMWQLTGLGSSLDPVGS